MKLSGGELAQLRDLVVESMESEIALARFVSDRINVRLETIVERGNLQDVVFRLLQWLEANGRTEEFIGWLSEDRPHLAGSLNSLREKAAAPPRRVEEVEPQPRAAAPAGYELDDDEAGHFDPWEYLPLFDRTAESARLFQ